MRRDRCSICNNKRFLFFDTPNDPPFYPARDGERHCLRCERWLKTGSTWDWTDVAIIVGALVVLALAGDLISMVR